MSTVTCRLCGNVFTRPPRAYRQEFCPGTCERQAVRLRQQTTRGRCAEGDCTRSAAYGRRICEAHRSARRFSRPCDRCGRRTQRNDSAHCKICKAILQAVGASCKVSFATCRVCKTLYAKRPNRRHCPIPLTRNGKRTEYVRVVERDVPCRRCGKLVVARYARKLCADCLAASERSTRRHARHVRRLRRKGAAVGERIDLKQLRQRDGDRCHLCKRKVNARVHYNHNDYPSVDHLIPLSVGGSHAWQNVALAHRGCNSKRKTSGPAQLRLIA